MTAVYAFMSASPFAYRQFLAPRVFGWTGTFSDWHGWLYWGWFALALCLPYAGSLLYSVLESIAPPRVALVQDA